MKFLNIALELEEKAIELYDNLSNKCRENKGLQRILGLLKEDHVGHAEAIKELKEKNDINLEKSETIEFSKKLFSEMRSEERDFSCQIEQVELYKKGKELIEHKVDFYKKSWTELKDENHKKLINSIIDEEKKQVYVLENLIDMINKPNYWVENAEFYHFDEY